MTLRERYLNSLLFGKPDRVTLEPGYGRESTLKRWHEEGLSSDIKNGKEAMKQAYIDAGGSKEWGSDGENFSVNERMVPQFDEIVIEKRERSQIVQDWKGNICEIGNEYTIDYLRTSADFVTRRWVKLPVETRADWESMKKRYDADDPSRLPADAVERGARLKDRDWPVIIKFSGPFWQLREWVGFEGLCMMIYDDPELVSEMCRFWESYVMRLMERIFEHIIPDEIYISEDMAYKSFPMVSPDHVKQFFLPVWKRWGEYLKSKGVKIYAMDSDGNVDLLIPFWIEAGINVCDPIEVAAGNDIVEFRKKYGTKMAFRGGVDKRAIAKGGEAIEKEIERLMPVIKSGGFIPGCDHAVPHDISWENYVYYTKLLANATGWIAS